MLTDLLSLDIPRWGQARGIIEKLNYPQISLLILAWFVTDLVTPLLLRLAPHLSALDRPRAAYKAQRQPVPFLGGVAIVIGFAVSLVSILRFTGWTENFVLFSILGASLLMLLMGLWDDFRPIWAVAKLAVTIVVTLVLSYLGVRIELTAIPILDTLLTLLWISGVTSAINSLDNMDGAAVGVSAIAAFWTFHISWNWQPYGQVGVTYLSVALLGACIGFLRYNFKPAGIYLGNSGAFFLGCLLASMMVLTGWSRTDPLKAVIVPCAILCVPIYDISLATLLRIVNGVVRNPIDAITYCGRDHLSHRLVALGLSQREAVLMLYLFAMVSGAVGSIVWKKEVGADVYLPILGVAVAIMAGLGMLLNKAPVYASQESEAERVPPSPEPTSTEAP